MADDSLKKRTRIILLLAVIGLPLILWMALYPQATDPKSLRYQAWKIGLPVLNMNTAYEAMIGDARRFDLVKGKNLEAIKKRFGLVRRDDLLPYQEFCLKNGSYHDKDIAFLGDSKWMILFEDGKVVDLILCKGM